MKTFNEYIAESSDDEATVSHAVTKSLAILHRSPKYKHTVDSAIPVKYMNSQTHTTAVKKAFDSEVAAGSAKKEVDRFGYTRYQSTRK